MSDYVCKAIDTIMRDGRGRKAISSLTQPTSSVIIDKDVGVVMPLLPPNLAKRFITESEARSSCVDEVVKVVDTNRSLKNIPKEDHYDYLRFASHNNKGFDKKMADLVRSRYTEAIVVATKAVKDYAKARFSDVEVMPTRGYLSNAGD